MRSGSTLSLFLASSAALGLALGGCEQLRQAEGADSLFDVIFTQPTSEEAVTLALDEFSSDARFRGIGLLMNQPGGATESALELYRDRLDDEDAGVRQVAAMAIGLHGEPADAEQLAVLLSDDDPRVRLEAARSLQRIHNPAVVRALLRSIRPEAETDQRVRSASAAALGQYPESRVLQGLVGALDDVFLAVNAEAVWSLETLTGQDLGLVPSAWLAWIREQEDPFAAGRPYEYPGYQRKRKLVEYIPLLPGPPTESPGLPVGLVREPPR